MATKVGIISLGCAKNQVDAEMLLYKIREAGYEISDDPGICDIAIVNTCGFIESAKQESIDEILELATLKREGQIKKLVVTGCLAERYNNELMKEMCEIDAVVGIGGNEDIVTVLNRVMGDEKVNIHPDKLLMPLEGKRLQSTPPYTAYIKISEGCDNRCTYCAIPLIRGGHRSRKMEDIISEATDLANKGVKELNVIAQDTTRYGMDLYGEYRLAKLLKELCKIDGFKWIRVLYCYPDKITDELIDVIKTEEKICKYIDIPLQHCNKDVLRRMNRSGDKDSLLALINKLRKEIPDIVIRTTFIAGFPGETEEEFTELCEFAKEAKFQRMGCFPYSVEEGTPAAEFPNQLDEETKAHRAEIIMDQQSYIMDEYLEGQIGKEMEILCEGYDRYAECYFGRGYCDAPDVDTVTFFTATGEKPKVGEFYNVEITDFLDSSLVGKIID
ncbi:MAG: 30S ribosomal protein S12 methylthiotransferase RimO [Oscillospiraceae bacterium]|nr:30S ribosomal protein S12 methylthiotransferase RimO [Oscillospiraceae bacterium]